jgi:N-acyl homoserine lactone hydrolase
MIFKIFISLIFLFFNSKLLYADELYIFKYGESFYPNNYLNVKKAEGLKRINWYFYLYQTNRKKILIDTGICDTKDIKKFKIKGYRSALDLLSDLGISNNEITDVIITHSHFDHIGCVNYFINSKLHIQEKEWDDFIESKSFIKYREFFENNQNVNLIKNSFLIDDLNIELSGGHTIGSQYVFSDKFLITGDECYFIDNCLDGIGLPEKARYSEMNNKNFIKSIIQKKDLNPDLIILSLHDPKLFNKYIKINDFISLINLSNTK